ncbi:septal ring lytic transglycosylase RlpA family protein [Noviherbaspirillum sp.]|uniref:septal ring lytic transglycosylase RlpA family protein n=1 Tax=Noviherbaspirillum sp. TaxID=1926288 RepID=UPI002FE0A66B
MQLLAKKRIVRSSALLLTVLSLYGCGSSVQLSETPANAPAGRQSAPSKSASNTIPALPPAGSGRGGYYQDDGPGDNVPPGLLDLPDPEPRVEPYARRGNQPYTVFGKTYTPITDSRPLKQQGVGSWYGKKFHGQKTSSGELYDMYKITAAHPTLPIPSYARVTNLANGKQVIVRVNDRGPFLGGRIIDLSYAAALKLGYLEKGSSQLEVERLLPEDIERIAAARREQAPMTASSTTAPAAIQPALASGTPSEGAVALPVAAPVLPPISMIASSDIQPSVTQQAVPSAAPGFYIQLGAFAQAANAEAARARLMQKYRTDLPPVEVMQQGTLYRLHSGPFATRAEAASAAQQLQDVGATRPMVVQR